MFPKIGGKTSKMDGENNGKPYEQMDELGGRHPYFWIHPYIVLSFVQTQASLCRRRASGVLFEVGKRTMTRYHHLEVVALLVWWKVNVS